MEAPESVVISLQAIRDTFELRWNPLAVRIRPGSFSADGSTIPAEFEGRFELWDRSPEGVEYMVVRVQTPAGGFKLPDDRWVEFIRHINPEHWNGDPRRMIRYFVDNPEELREQVADSEFDDLAEMVAKFAAWRRRPKTKPTVIRTPYMAGM